MEAIDPRYKQIFLRVIKEKNIKLHRCSCGAKLKLRECNIARITIESCNCLGCMTLSRRGEHYEKFVERVCNAWNYGEYEHTNSAFN